MSAEAQVGEMSVSTLKARLEAGGPLLLLDVREDHERAYARIETPPGPVEELHIPLGQITARAGEVIARARECPVVVYCHHGHRSMTAATWLARQGVPEIHNLDGGIDAWSMRVAREVRRY